MKHVLMTVFILLFCFGGISAGPINTTIDVEFIHPGDDMDVGTASLLVWKWTIDTTMTWDQWTMITDTITPLISPTLDTAHFDIEFPESGTYWIGVMVADEVPNWSGICLKLKLVLYDKVGPSCATGTIIGVTWE